MTCRRVNVEEVYKNCDGDYFGMSSGRQYEKSEVEKIGNFHWTIANHAPDVWEVEDSHGGSAEGNEGSKKN